VYWVYSPNLERQLHALGSILQHFVQQMACSLVQKVADQKMAVEQAGTQGSP
jgi:hypothetical protein